MHTPKSFKPYHGNRTNAGAARGRPVAMATQETHYASMAQVVEPS